MRRAPWLLGLLLAWACHTPLPNTRVERAGVSLRRVEQAESSAESRLLLQAGDYVFTGRGMRAVIGGLQRPFDQRGNVLELVSEPQLSGQPHVSLSHVLYVGGVARPLAVRRMMMIERAGQPTLRIEGSVVVAQHELRVAREVALGSVHGTLSITLRAQADRDHQVRDLRFGVQVQWGGPSPFVAGIGVLEDENFHRVDWVAAQAHAGSAALAFASTGLSARASYEQHQNQRLIMHTDVVEESAFALKNGVPVYRKLGVVVGATGVSDGVRTIGLWRGRPFREVWAHLPYRPDGAEVELRDERKRLVLVGKPDANGSVVLPIIPVDGTLPRKLDATALAYGHATSDTHPVRVGDAPFELRIPHGGQIRLRARDARDLSALPVRARIVPRVSDATFSLGPDYRASGAGDTLVTLQGAASVPVPPGRYTVLVSHGLEWSLHEANVEVSETFSPLVAADLTQQVNPGPYVACDLHVHSALSPDSQVSLADRLTTLAAEGVQFAVPTDHNHVTDYAPTARELKLSDFNTVPGVEVTTWDPAFGHFNAYPFPFDATKPNQGAPEHTHLTPTALFETLHALDPDMVVQINHPRLEGGIGYFDVMRLDAHSGAADPRYSGSFDAVEVFNGFDLARPEQTDAVFRDWMALLGRGRRVAATGSSDSHQVRYQLAGYPRTYAAAPELLRRDPRQIVRSIKRGASFITSGPFLDVAIGGAGPGAQATAQAGKVTLEIRVRAADWIPLDRLQVYLGEQLVHQATLSTPQDKPRPVERFHGQLELTVANDTFVVVRVAGEGTLERFFGRAGVLPLAFSNPIFIDADGDGRTPWSLHN